MLTRIFHKAMAPPPGRQPAAGRSGRAVARKQAIPGEASGAEPADFRETLLQAAAAAGGGAPGPERSVPAVADNAGPSPEEAFEEPREKAAPPAETAAPLPSPGSPLDEAGRPEAAQSGDEPAAAAPAGADSPPEAPEAPSALLPADPENAEAAAAGGEAAAPAEAMARVVDHARFLRRGESQEIEILLRPESLGCLRVRVASDGRGVSVRILAEKASAAESLSAHGARLRADLDAAGLDLADFEISVAPEEEDFRSPENSEAVLRQHVPPAPAGKGPPDRGRIDYFA